MLNFRFCGSRFQLHTRYLSAIHFHHQRKQHTQQNNNPHHLIIDLKPILRSEHEKSEEYFLEKQRIANQIHEALRTKGFFYVKNSPLDEDTIEQTFDVAKHFFQKTMEEKMKVASTDDNRFGYYRFHGTGFGEEK